MQKGKLIIAAAILLLITIGFFTQRYAMACSTVQYRDFRQIGPNIFASPSVTNEKQIVTNIIAGKKRIDDTFGTMQSLPRIVLVGNKKEAASLGSNLTGVTLLTPFNSCVVLGPKGQNTDVASHELMHAEIFTRVGWFKYWLEIPTWFNEGIALIVDHRKPFLLKNINLDDSQVHTVQQLTTTRLFFSGANVQQNYLASRLAVEPINVSHLYKNLERIKSGERFDRVFDTLK